MISQSVYAKNPGGISPEELREILRNSIADCRDSLKKVLLLVPDITRFHSCAGQIANIYYHELCDTCQVDLLPALGTHKPMTDEEMDEMYGDIPHDRFIVHDWRKGVVKIGEVPAEYVAEVSEGTYCEKIDVEVSRHFYDGYDLILSIGQVVPHEVVGMANHSKNIFVGCGGSAMISSSHILGAFYGLERMMGKDHSPVRKVFDYACRFLADLPIHYVMTVNTAPGGVVNMHGIFIGAERKYFEDAIALSQEKNITYLEKSVPKIVTYLDPKEFKSTWLGGKAIYRTRMAVSDGGEIVVLAPGVDVCGEDEENDRVIRKYGYCGRENVIALCKTEDDMKNNLSAAAHLIHGSADGRFTITHCDKILTAEEVKALKYNYVPYDEAVKKYDPEKLQPGFNTLPDGEEIYYVPNPALGLWIAKDRI